MNITVVIPSYKVQKHILEVINDIPEFVNHIVVVSLVIGKRKIFNGNNHE
jgi:hypothetical protein